MSATPRDALKTRAQRLGEVYDLLYKKAGQANSQIVVVGGDLVVNSTPQQFDVNPGPVFVLGQTEYGLGQAAITGNVVPAGATTAAGQFRKVLIEIDSSLALTLTPGAVVTTAQADAVLPKGATNRVSLGWLELPASFTAGTTALTTGMLKKMPYWTTTSGSGNNAY